MKKYFTKIIALMIAPILAFQIYGIYQGNSIPRIKAVGDLSFYYFKDDVKTLINGDPVFTVPNVAPGDVTERDIIVENNDPVARYVYLKGQSTEDNDNLSEMLFVEIWKINYPDANEPLYGVGTQKTLKNFFDESDVDDPDVSGIALSVVDVSGEARYQIKVTFSTEAQNEYQNTSLTFDLHFGIVAANDLVINEVFYQVDPSLGADSLFDRPTNKAFKKGQNDEWVELFNPTDKPISLKNWKLVATDENGGVLGQTQIKPNKVVKPGSFALVSHDASTWKYWVEDADALKVEVGQDIGGGLRNSGMCLTLVNNLGEDISGVCWGINGWYFDGVNGTKSIERIVPGYSNGLFERSDWKPDATSPTPGF